MKGAIAGFCVSLAVIGAEIATGIELSLGVRLMIIIPLCVLAGIIVAEK